MKPIVVITYDYPHRKTQDVIFGLKAANYQHVMLLALPFVVRENPFKPIFKHRPTKAYPIDPQTLAHHFGYDCKKVSKENMTAIIREIQPKAILIAGAGILPSDLVQQFPILNSHPAYLPEVRGLDALKWAIYYQLKIGVTTHIVNENADAGWLLDRTEIPVYTNDTFHSVAFRQYRTEIEFLVNAIPLIKNTTDLMPLEEKGTVHKRMPKKIEKNLLVYFEAYQKAFAKTI